MQRLLSLPSIAAVAACLLATVLVVPVLAGATGAMGSAEPVEPFNRDVPQFEYTGFNESDCGEQPTYRVLEADGVNEPLDPQPDIEPEELDGGDVRFAVPSLEGGEYRFERSCEDGLDSVYFAHARVLVTKTVEGEPPADAAFTINVACEGDGEPFDVDRELQDGEQGQVVFYRFQNFEYFFDGDVTCTITEPDRLTDDQSVTIEPEQLTYTDWADGESTVTNTFPAAEPSPAPSPEPSPSPTEDVDDTVEEAEPAEPVEVEPDFTG